MEFWGKRVYFRNAWDADLNRSGRCSVELLLDTLAEKGNKFCCRSMELSCVQMVRRKDKLPEGGFPCEQNPQGSLTSDSITSAIAACLEDLGGLA